jgi:Mycothiol maleylpyruvate isomerase N-terminal domain
VLAEIAAVDQRVDGVPVGIALSRMAKLEADDVRRALVTGCPIMAPMHSLRRPGPVETLHLYPGERAELLGVLDGLSAADWERPTVCPGWSVRDVALHLLADDLGVLSRQRDEHRAEAPRPDESLGVFLARINDEWIIATRRLSGRVVVDLLRWSGDLLLARHLLSTVAVIA